MATITIFKLGSLPAVSKTLFSQKRKSSFECIINWEQSFWQLPNPALFPWKGKVQQKPPPAWLSFSMVTAVGWPCWKSIACIRDSCSAHTIAGQQKHGECQRGFQPFPWIWPLSAPPVEPPVVLPSGTRCPSLCHCLSHRAPSQVTGSSSGASKEKGRSNTITTIFEPKTDEQVLWFKINNGLPCVENQHFPTYSYTDWTDSGFKWM